MKNILKLKSKEIENVFYVYPRKICTKEQHSKIFWDIS